ncbi:PREDICTED: translation initiation factor IF-2-like isoform X2 [Cyprinodon variegatus]|uniref:translation initiation factor IF-2-like isoform X2 n=1 Tax=Cyprinodon variegatus TaxID=28743 RepID=UPI00074255A5|nr:PREDICTED: translation initiation factor IF-2-like isoform X2 [Cyprinodon variegatus]
MMSYLWILLLGSLLASQAKAQDSQLEDTPPNGETEPEATDPVVDGTESGTVTEAPQTDSQPEPSDDPVPAADPEPVTDPISTAEPEDDSEPATDVDSAAEPESTTEPVADPGTTPEPEQAEEPEETPAPTTELAEPAIATEKPLYTETDTTVESSVDVAEPNQFTEEPNITPTADGTVAPAPDASTTSQVNDLDAGSKGHEQTTAAVDEETTAAPAAKMPDEATRETISDSKTEDTIGSRIFKKVVHQVQNAIQDLGNEDPNVGATADKGAQSGGKGTSKPLAGILSGIIVSAVGAVAGYFTYQKKKLCFKKSPEADVETGAKADRTEEVAKADPQESNTLLNSSQQQSSD